MPDKYGRFYYFEQVGHDDDCREDEAACTVCEGMYIQKVDIIIELCEALRAIYALAGENREVRNIIHPLLEKYDI